MKKTSAYHYFSLICNNTYNRGNPYKFAKHMDLGSDKYKEGVITVLDWVNQVAYHYIEKEQTLKCEFDEIIHAQEKYLRSTLPATPYKEGIIKGFTIANDVLHETKKRKFDDLRPLRLASIPQQLLITR